MVVTNVEKKLGAQAAPRGARGKVVKQRAGRHLAHLADVADEVVGTEMDA